MKNLFLFLFFMLVSCQDFNNLKKNNLGWCENQFTTREANAASVHQLARIPFTGYFWKLEKLPENAPFVRDIKNAVVKWQFITSKSVAWGPTYCYLFKVPSESQLAYLLECKDFTIPRTMSVAKVECNWLGFWRIKMWYFKDQKSLDMPELECFQRPKS